MTDTHTSVSSNPMMSLNQWTKTYMNEHFLTSGSGTWENTVEMQKESSAASKRSITGWRRGQEVGRSPAAIIFHFPFSLKATAPCPLSPLLSSLLPAWLGGWAVWLRCRLPWIGPQWPWMIDGQRGVLKRKEGVLSPLIWYTASASPPLFFFLPTQSTIHHCSTSHCLPVDSSTSH